MPEHVKADPQGAYYEVNLTLPPVQRSGKALRLRVSSAQYFVVENRASEGVDAQRPGGALVWHVDERLRLLWADLPPNDAPVVPALKHTWAERHYGVRLVQPDRSYALKRTRAKWGDNGLVSRGAYFGWDPAAQLGGAVAGSDALFALATYAAMERGDYGFARIARFRLHDFAGNGAESTDRSTGDVSLTFSYGTRGGARGDAHHAACRPGPRRPRATAPRPAPPRVRESELEVGLRRRRVGRSCRRRTRGGEARARRRGGDGLYLLVFMIS